jgi:uncharacterized OB-fold protein
MEPEIPTRLVGTGLFEEENGIAYLLGCVCSDCGEVVFPFMQDCPRCMTFGTMRPKRLAGTGVIRDFVIAQRGATGFRVPYSMIDAPASEDTISAGDRVTMRVQQVRQEDGVAVIGWMFHPSEQDGLA